MDKDLILAKINAIAVIIAAIIGGLLTIVSSIIENNKLKKEYDDLKNKFNVLTNNPKESKDVSYEVDRYFTEEDQKEVDEILETLFNVQNNNNNKQVFASLLKDIDAVELFYKTQICMRYYKYSNIISAFDKYGIECEPISITEKILELWDIEMLYIFYQILENIENSKEKCYLFKNYKMEPIDKYNYMEYGYCYPDKTYGEISIIFNDYINRILKKMKRNSILIG